MALAAVLALVVGWLRRGKLSRLAALHFPFWWLIPIAFLIQASLRYLVDRVDYKLLFIIYLVSFVLIAISLIANVKKRYVALVLAGIVMNFTVIALNQGMPFYDAQVQLRANELKAVNGLHVPATSRTLLGFLGDWVALPPPYPQPTVLSPGDVVVALGLFLFIQGSMAGDGKAEELA